MIESQRIEVARLSHRPDVRLSGAVPFPAGLGGGLPADGAAHQYHPGAPHRPPVPVGQPGGRGRTQREFRPASATVAARLGTNTHRERALY